MKKVLISILLCTLLTACTTAHTDDPHISTEESQDDSFGGNDADSDGTSIISLDQAATNVNELPLISDGIDDLINNSDYENRSNLSSSIVRMMLNQIDGFTKEDLNEMFSRSKNIILAVNDESDVSTWVKWMVDDLYDNVQYEGTFIDITKYDKHDLYCADWKENVTFSFGEKDYTTLNLYVTLWDETICFDTFMNYKGKWFLAPTSYSTWVCRGKSVLEWMIEGMSYDALYEVGKTVNPVYATSDYVSNILTQIVNEFELEENEIYSYEWRGVRSTAGIDYYICNRWDENDNYFCVIIADGYGWDGCYIPAEYAAIHKDGINYNYTPGSKDIVSEEEDFDSMMQAFYDYIDTYE